MLLAPDTPHGRAFATLQSIFPGQVVEVAPLNRPAAGDAGGERGEAAEAEDAYAAGYDDPDGQDVAGEDA